LFSCFEDEERLKMSGGGPGVAVSGLPEHHNKTKRLKNEQQLNNSDY
jgi:hypothetical protein